ncbi:hypothetical protein BD779DRAFT_1471926 [Infundibulicybe gibba]|nr:hypothetical protein BD779DRAFT_1471926 [Infundibulicybe gibba]
MEGLPVEIIQVIFLELCPPPTTFPLRRGEPTLLVTHICSQWRAIAISTPTLWASCYINFVTFCPPQPEPIHAWISRAAQSSLSLNFHGSARYFDTSPMIVDIVFPVIHRCSFLSFCLDTITLNRLLTLPPGSLRTLRSMTIIVEDKAQMADITPFSTAFESCPQLHTFALVTNGEYYPKNLRITNFRVPWHQLTTLRLCSASILAHECLDILQQCASLQECSIFVSPIEGFVLQRVVEHSHRPTVLPFLHTLYTKFLNPQSDNCCFLWHALRLPRLRKFQPMGPAYSAPWSLSKFQSVLCDTIEELDLSRFRFPESLPETLALAFNVETLWLSGGSHKYPGIMRALGEGTISPHLTTLYLSSVKSFDFLFDVIEARVTAAHANRGIAAFAKVVVMNRGIEPLDEARLTVLAEAGVQIQLGYPR